MKKSLWLTKLYRQSELEKIEKDLNCLGKDTKYNVELFVRDRLLVTIIITILVIFLTKLGYILAPFVAFGTYYLFYYLNITRKMNIRNKRLENEAIFFFEILSLTLESGNNLEGALRVTCDNVDSEISDEFKKALFEMQFGKSLIEALSDMRSRISSNDINNIILNIIQTSQFGNSILNVLYNEIDFLRTKQILAVKSQINKIPNKASIISVIFVVPLILVLILGPYLIEFIS